MGDTFFCCCLLPTPGSVSRRHPGQSYFTDYTVQKALFYAVVLAYVASTTLVAFAQPFIPLPCTDDDDEAGNVVDERALNSGDGATGGGKYANPDYVNSLCDRTRFPRLLFMTVNECDFSRRVVAAVILGGIIGWERRQADRPAGIRTMSLVSLGSCLFTICSTFAFASGPNTWDASRISAAIPSGVGFLGAGLIFKQADTDEETGEQTHVVHGLKTAASLWLSAAVGIACGGELYFAAAFSTATLLVLLRFGPRNAQDEIDQEEDEENFELSGGRSSGTTAGSVKKDYTSFAGTTSMTRSVTSESALSIRSVRSKPQLL